MSSTHHAAHPQGEAAALHEALRLALAALEKAIDDGCAIEAHDRRKQNSINYVDDFALGTWAPVKKAEPTPAPAASSSKKPNRDFTTADYELIQDEKLLDEWIAEATRAGTVAFDCETDGLDSNNAGLVGVSLALLEGPWGDVNSTRRRGGCGSSVPIPC